MACKGGNTCQFASSDVEAIEALNNFVCENCTYSRVRKQEKDKEEIIVEEKF